MARSQINGVNGEATNLDDMSGEAQFAAYIGGGQGADLPRAIYSLFPGSDPRVFDLNSWFAGVKAVTHGPDVEGMEDMRLRARVARENPLEIFEWDSPAPFPSSPSGDPFDLSSLGRPGIAAGIEPNPGPKGGKSFKKGTKKPKQQQRKKPKGQPAQRRAQVPRNNISKFNQPLTQGNSGSGVGMNKKVANGICTIAHRELVGTLAPAGSVGFENLDGYLLNPGWSGAGTDGNYVQTPYTILQPEAENFVKYRRRGMRFRFVSSCPSTTAGEIYIMFLPRWNQAPPFDETQASATRHLVFSSVWKDCSLTIPPMTRSKFVRTGCPVGDVEDYEDGIVYVGVAGAAVGGPTIGRLYIEYLFDLSEQDDFQQGVVAIPTNGALIHSDTAQMPFTCATGVTTFLHYNSFPAFAAGAGNNPLGIQISGTNDDDIVLQPGAYFVWAQVIVQDSAAEVFSGEMNLYLGGVEITDGALAVGSQTHGWGIRGYTSTGSANNVAAQNRTMSAFGVAIANSTTGFNLNALVKLTGAAGTLTVRHFAIMIKPM
jgi:hypothetical protein